MRILSRAPFRSIQMQSNFQMLPPKASKLTNFLINRGQLYHADYEHVLQKKMRRKLLGGTLLLLNRSVCACCVWCVCACVRACVLMHTCMHARLRGVYTHKELHLHCACVLRETPTHSFRLECVIMRARSVLLSLFGRCKCSALREPPQKNELRV